MELLNSTIYCYDIGYRVVPSHFAEIFDVSEDGKFTLLTVTDASLVDTHTIILESYVTGYETTAAILSQTV